MTVTVSEPAPWPVSPMALLRCGIPLSLLLDLVCGPDSADLLDNELAPQDEPGQ